MKRSLNFLPHLFLACALVLFWGCPKDENGDPGPDPSDDIIYITDDIDAPTTWSNDYIYVITAWDFYVKNTLTIEAGTIIKFHASDGPYLNLGGSGTLIAQGTSSAPIIFTSLKDDAHGGDTNKDGNATSPMSGDWGEISTNGLNGSSFSYCQFLYGGRSGTTLDLFDSRTTVRNCTFAYNEGGELGSVEGALNAAEALAGSVIQNNTFYGNKIPLTISGVIDIDNSNTFHNPADASETNKYNGIFLDWGADIETTIRWEETEVPFVIDDVDWWVDYTGTLILGNNVVLKFMPDSYLNLEQGATALSNHNGSGVAFTSIKDDSRKGDTNGDGTVTTAGEYDWGGIYDNQSGYYLGWGNIFYDSY